MMAWHSIPDTEPSVLQYSGCIEEWNPKEPKTKSYDDVDDEIVFWFV